MAAQQRSVVLPVRALDGRATSVRLPATASVRDLKATLRVCFPPAQDAPAFHLFLLGGKLLLDAKLANLSLARGEFVSLIPFTGKPAVLPTASANPNPRAGPPVFSAAKRSKFSSSLMWRGEDVYAKIAGVPVHDPASPSFYCHGVEPLDPARMVEHLKQGLGKHGQIRHVQEIPGSEASFCPLPSHLSKPTREALRAIGVTRLYSHQAQAIASAASASGKSKHVVVSTSTASGKSLCYNDQLKTLRGMVKGAGDLGDVVSIYDSDTPMKHRARIRDGARLLITNPDMLHVSILPCHAQFRRILSNLEYVVIDEAHSYRGAFGCHTALILRRLKRVCADVYGSHPTFVSCTATLANARERVTELAGLDADDVELVQNDGSPCGSKHFLLWNPSVSRQGRCPSAAQEVSHLFAEMVQHGLRCIAFCKTRKLCEAVLARAREILEETSAELADTICVYRGGYVAEDRRRIEAGLFGGTLRGVAATNALELGIDVGGIDATLHLGFPGSMASLWQQAGRSGRRSKPSIAIYVGLDGALDQYFMSFPHKLFGKPVEHCHVDSRNRKVLGQHLACAAFEKPLCPEHDARHFGPGMDGAMVTLRDQGHLTNTNTNSSDQSGVCKYVGPDKNPARAVSIRAIEHDRYKVVDKQGYRVLEEIEESKAFVPGARRRRVHAPGRQLLGRAAGSVDEDGVRFDRIWKSNDQMSDSIELDLPPYSFHTQAVWVSVPVAVKAAVEQRGLGFDGGVQAASHALLTVLPLRMMCAASDLGTRCAAAAARGSWSGSGAPGDGGDRAPWVLLLYDKHPGGIGLAAQVERLFGELLVAALQLVSACGCAGADGCPSCVQSFACGGHNRNLDKLAAVLILRGVIENESGGGGSRRRR
ncbi:unnamed protein product [Miscanthus lutarioriparius]|uniref:Uncharacterized protein n=1 Tax=Miscanthus lutarioriparius TaxID=422564 RepID=A0A811PW84_9POAL|nr:unnamed protein product [Miscanthus lutarioriparius]